MIESRLMTCSQYCHTCRNIPHERDTFNGRLNRENCKNSLKVINFVPSCWKKYSESGLHLQLQTWQSEKIILSETKVAFEIFHRWWTEYEWSM